ncbi:choice-of-anchor J domain-containing protein [Flavobacterium psychrophilum]|uniref:Choice-of-anchor J domain-containing protein n=1 Tax=Flavobacterium psychrophilum TaxID=96345 RepID=A0A7U2R9G6_FLAPS|nr:DUF5689 domain-containing protein [Flavobacterium psychrophilum]EKT3957634.1 choice-of-anchor J domain-containing protein [Flavobacterium psychrophilum]EKT4501485.1 choice-of-anchor J domain-containing protein [Flavobacterium psychrophilum]QRE03980.1 choice-of-anchor J domain-containing protein [Flavobacterium psychrophilum]
MKNIKIILSIFTFGFLSSCVNDTFEDPKTKDCISAGLVKNKEVADIYAIAINPTGSIPNTPTYTANDIIEGYVVSSDEGGNFYQNMYVQPIGGGKGYNLSVDLGNVYNKGYEPGRKVFLKMKGLAYGNPTNFAAGLIFGAPPTDKYTVDRLPALDLPKHLIPSCDAVNEDAIVNHITLTQAKAPNNPYLNTLVEFDNVQFETEGISYDTDRSDKFDSSITIEDGITSFIVRTSRYAGFAGNIVPSKKGKIKGVLTKYGTSSYQLILRTERDVKLTQPRVDFATPIVGNANVFTGTLNEPFTTYAVDQVNFPKYINDANVSSRYWSLKQYPTGTGNKYIEMSSYGGGGVTAKTYFLVPVDFTAANTFTFKKQARYYSGGTPLQVYYVSSANYVPGSVINSSVFTNITSNFTISYPAVSGSETAFSSVGTYSIPAGLTGNGYFVFEYSGTPALTTTIQVDDIVIN